MRLPLLCALLVLMTCGGDEGADAVIVAEDLRFLPARVEVAAGEITLAIENRDEGVNHNIHITDAAGSAATDLAEGTSTQSLTVTIDEPGEYEVICDLHPNMVLVLAVE